MDPNRWRRVEELYHAARTRAPETRAAFLDEACAGDRELRRDVESLLAQPTSSDRFLGEPALAAAAQMISNPGGTMLTGQRIGVYQVQTLLGSGGMGEVYRARDTRLGRDVAIKILPKAFTSDPDRLARFEREARMLATLNHPHIATVYGLEEGRDGHEGAIHAIAMELVEGETLAERLGRGRLAISDALRIAAEIADALSTAHEKGIVHRDLKPANIKITPAGRVKVLDFGLAKAGEDGPSRDLSKSPTVTVGGTHEGVILGTAAYMSPEQARGRPVDKRADIWAFGCVLFEMLTGTPPFRGEDVAEVIGAVIHKEPLWDALPANAPVSIRATLQRCLQKDPKHRLQDIGDVQMVLSGAFESPTQVVLAPPARAPAWQRALPWAVVGTLALALIVVLARWAPWRTPTALAVQRLEAALGADVSLANTQLGPSAILSPDGQTLAFVGQSPGGPSQLYVRPFDQLKATVLPGTDNAASPFFSPDGRWVAFFAINKLKKIAVTGGAAVTLCDVTGNSTSVRSGTFADAGTIIVGQTGAGGRVEGERLLRVSSAGGTPEALLTLAEGEATQRWPQVLPGGKAVLFTSHTATAAVNFDDATIVVQTLPAGPRKVLVRGGYYGRYLSSGHLVYVHENTLFAVPFDLDRLEVTGPPVPVINGVAGNPGNSGAAQFAASETGTLVYLPEESAAREAPIDWVDHTGKVTTLRAMPANWTAPVFSPDGRQLAMNISGTDGSDIWLYDQARDGLTRLTSGATGARPVWTPDGRRITYQSKAGSTVANLYWQRVDGTGEVQRLTESKNVQLPVSWHPSGKFLTFTELSSQTQLDVMILPMEGDEASGWKPGKPTVFLSTPASEFEAMFSPDGRWIAYESNQSGRSEVYVRPFPGPGGARLISAGGGGRPSWSRSRHELFYQTEDQHIMVVPYLAEGESFRAEQPHLWSDMRYTPRLGMRSYALDPDGDRIAMAPATTNRQDRVVLIYNFFDELRRLAPTRK